MDSSQSTTSPSTPIERPACSSVSRSMGSPPAVKRATAAFHNSDSRPVVPAAAARRMSRSRCSSCLRMASPVGPAGAMFLASSLTRSVSDRAKGAPGAGLSTRTSGKS